MWLWMIVSVLLFAAGSYILGTLDVNEDDKIGLMGVAFFGALLWPLILAIVIVVGPFVGLFWLGQRKRKQKEESTKNK
jgi:uncharacterized membrane protein